MSTCRCPSSFFASHSSGVWEFKQSAREKNKSRGILRTPGLINWGKPRCQLRIKNNSLIIFYLHLSNYGFERNSKINISYNDLIAFSLDAAQEILLNLAGNSSIGFWVQSILNQVSNGWAWPGCRFRFLWPRPLNNIFTFASWRENLWQNHATSCHKIYRRPALCSQVLSLVTTDAWQVGVESGIQTIFSISFGRRKIKIKCEFSGCASQMSNFGSNFWEMRFASWGMGVEMHPGSFK